MNALNITMTVFVFFLRKPTSFRSPKMLEFGQPTCGLHIGENLVPLIPHTKPADDRQTCLRLVTCKAARLELYN